MSSINYLGVCLLSGKSLTVDVSASKRKFYMSCNCILSNSSNLCELVQLYLQQTYSLPILTYAIAAIKISDKQLKEINASWNSMYRRIFKFPRWESVKLFFYGLGNLDLSMYSWNYRLNFIYLCNYRTIWWLNNGSSSLRTLMSLLSLVVCQDGGRTWVSMLLTVMYMRNLSCLCYKYSLHSVYG